MGNASAKYTVPLLVAVAAGAIGPRCIYLPDQEAGENFQYFPPSGFVLSSEVPRLPPSDNGARGIAWVHESQPNRYTPNVTLTHSTNRSALTEGDVVALAGGMKSVFAQSGVGWREIRHQSRLLSKGERVGILEGECTKRNFKYRALQIAFPDDQGTSIVTASYPVEEASRWSAEFDDSILTAKGIAVRGVPPPLWVYLVWGVGGELLGLVLYRATVQRRRRSRLRPNATLG